MNYTGTTTVIEMWDHYVSRNVTNEREYQERHMMRVIDDRLKQQDIEIERLKGELAAVKYDRSMKHDIAAEQIEALEADLAKYKAELEEAVSSARFWQVELQLEQSSSFIHLERIEQLEKELARYRQGVEVDGEVTKSGSIRCPITALRMYHSGAQVKVLVLPMENTDVQ